MKALVLKEIKAIFCSPSSAFFAIAYLVACGCLLWLFPGKYNILDNGYATLIPFFKLSPSLFIILIPALTMRLFAEEKRLKTFDVLKSRPVGFMSIYMSKAIAAICFIFVILLATFVYVCTIYKLANPVGNIDIPSTIASYIGLFILSFVFILIGLFASSVSKNQVIALLIGILLCAISFWGFDLVSDLLLQGKAKIAVSSIGLYYHYNALQRGVIQPNDIIIIVNYILFIFLITSIINKEKKIVFNTILSLIIISLVFLYIPHIHFDFTSDKRYTLSEYTHKLLTEAKNENKKINIDIFLDGDLNSGFQNLRNTMEDMLTDMNKLSNGCLNINYINPDEIDHNRLEKITKSGINAITLNETDRKGKISQKIIYPAALITLQNDTVPIQLFKNIQGYTAEENLNASIENLEFEFVDAFRLLIHRQQKNIAFIEGHEELPRSAIHDAEEVLSKYYSIHRGQIGIDMSELNNFDAIIIAGPIQQFSEAEKFIIDQYIMNGGKTLWLIDGVYYSERDLQLEGFSASIKNETNLDDMLFHYGIRINPDMVQDSQCASIYLSTDKNNTSDPIPCYYISYLIPSADNVITKNIRDVRTGFFSSIDFVNSSDNVIKKVLLTTSVNSHIVPPPEPVSFDIDKIQKSPAYFDKSFIPVAVSLEGVFNSAFQNRIEPDGLINQNRIHSTSQPTRMIVASSSDIIRNRWIKKNGHVIPLPMGYDEVSENIFGNREFIVNSLNWLTDDGWMGMRSKNRNLLILNKKKAYETQNQYAVVNIVIPVIFVFSIMGVIYIYRKRRYGK